MILFWIYCLYSAQRGVYVNIDPIKWHHSYEVGVEDIDLQHHYFVNLIGRIGEQIAKSKNKAFVEALINELNAYARFHFSSEETMMVQSNYPDYEVHKNHHRDLIQRLSVEQYNLLQNNSPEKVEAIITFLMDWFLHHTRQEDKLFADYLIEYNKKN